MTHFVEQMKVVVVGAVTLAGNTELLSLTQLDPAATTLASNESPTDFQDLPAAAE